MVHREPDMLPGEHHGQPAPLERAHVRLEEDIAGPGLNPGDILRIQGENETGRDVHTEVRWCNSFEFDMTRTQNIPYNNHVSEP